MRLEEMRKLAEDRPYSSHCKITENQIKLLGHIDRLLDVVEAAKALRQHERPPKLGQEVIHGWDALILAIGRLEES
jgi:hypothetical protein